VVGIGEESRPSHCASPLCSRIGWRYELRRHVARRTEGRPVEGCQIFLHSAACGLRGTLLVPVLARDRPLLVGVRRNQAGVDREPLAAAQARSNARFHDALEHAAENVAVTEALIPAARERGVIRDLVLDAQAAEPSIGEVYLHLPA